MAKTIIFYVLLLCTIVTMLPNAHTIAKQVVRITRVLLAAGIEFSRLYISLFPCSVHVHTSK